MYLPVSDSVKAHVSKRGKVYGYSRDTHVRYESALTEFFASKPPAHRYDISLVLTTTQRDPCLAKEDLRRWRDGMLHSFDCYGLYGMEFNDYDFVHYNVVLRFFGKDGATPVDTIIKRAKELWARRGYNHPKAVDFSVVWEADGLRRYMVKSDHQAGSYESKLGQKRLPDWLEERGTGCTWWGHIGKERANSGVAVGVFADPTLNDDSRAAA